MSLLVVGTVAFDSVETPFGKHDDVLGGSASFFATSASYFTPARIVSVVGKDFPKSHLDAFAERGIDTTGIEHQPGNTFRWRGRYDHNLNVAHTLETQLNVLQTFDPKVPASYRSSQFVFLGNFDPTLQRKVVEQLDGPRLIACDTMNYWIDQHSAELKKTLKLVHLLSINDGEARMLSGESNLRKAAQAIRAMGPRVLVIKRGEFGAVMFSDEGAFAAPAYLLEDIRDPTGAGDSFAGGMVGYLARHGSIEPPVMRQAVIIGSVMASFACEDFSLNRFKTLTPAQIRARFLEFKGLTHFESDGLGAW